MAETTLVHARGSSASISITNAASFAGDQIEIMIGDQEDRSFLRSIAAAVPRIDILLDDGGHTMKQQIATFEELFPHIDKTAFICAKTCSRRTAPTSAAGTRTDSFIEYSKNFIDYIHAWHSMTRRGST